MNVVGLDTWLAAGLGLGLAAAVGFRVFVPFLLVGLAAHTGHITLSSDFQWVASDLALIMFGAAALVEIIAYFIPYFDHLLDTISGPAAILAGTVLMASTLLDMAPWVRWTVALIAGGGTAGLLHAGTSALRLGSTATTGGIANPLFATIETGTSTGLVILAVTVPLLAFAIVLVLLRRTIRGLASGWKKIRPSKV